jgi:hypothetical protein
MNAEVKKDHRSECYHCTNKRDVPGNCHIRCVKPDANMRGDQHGVRRGWFMYPFLFDPVWKTCLCENFQNHESVNHAISGAVSRETNA